MAKWHRSRRADLGLRALGVLLCGLSYAAFARLAALHILAHSAGLTAYALATAGFITASSGTAMALLGRHLFDEIQVSARWRRDPPAATNAPPPGGVTGALGEPCRLVSEVVPLAGLEPACLAAFDFESNASTNFATGAAMTGR